MILVALVCPEEDVPIAVRLAKGTFGTAWRFVIASVGALSCSCSLCYIMFVVSFKVFLRSLRGG